MCSTVIFDLMGTLVADPYREAIEAATGLPLEEVVAERDPRAWPAFELGEIDEAEFARRFYADGGTFDLPTFHRVRRAGYRYLPGMRGLLDDLGGRARLHVATNYPVWVDELVARLGLDARVEGVWASCRLGVRKPDRAFYERILGHLDVDPATCLFVDDREVNCDAAMAMGMAAHRFVTPVGLRRRLVRAGLLAR